MLFSIRKNFLFFSVFLFFFRYFQYYTCFVWKSFSEIRKEEHYRSKVLSITCFTLLFTILASYFIQKITFFSLFCWFGTMHIKCVVYSICFPYTDIWVCDFVYSRIYTKNYRFTEMLTNWFIMPCMWYVEFIRNI